MQISSSLLSAMSPKFSLDSSSRIRRSEDPQTSPEPKSGVPAPEPKDLLSYIILIVLLIILFCFAMAVIKKLHERNRDDGSAAERVNINAGGRPENGARTAEDLNREGPIHPSIDFDKVEQSYAAPKLEDVIPKPAPPMPYNMVTKKEAEVNTPLAASKRHASTSGISQKFRQLLSSRPSDQKSSKVTKTNKTEFAQTTTTTTTSSTTTRTAQSNNLRVNGGTSLKSSSSVPSNLSGRGGPQ